VRKSLTARSDYDISLESVLDVRNFFRNQRIYTQCLLESRKVVHRLSSLETPWFGVSPNDFEYLDKEGAFLLQSPKAIFWVPVATLSDLQDHLPVSVKKSGSVKHYDLKFVCDVQKFYLELRKGLRIHLPVRVSSAGIHTIQNPISVRIRTP